MLILSRSRRRRLRQRSGGQVVMAFALMFCFFLFGLIASVIDLASLYTWQSAISRTAQDAAVAGAANVDIPNFRITGNVILLQSQAVAACSGVALADQGGLDPAVCTIAPATQYKITAVISKTVRLPIPIGLSSVLVSASYSAIAQCGTTVADTTCN